MILQRIVFLDEYAHLEEAERIARDADVFVIVGTSLTVLPRFERVSAES